MRLVDADALKNSIDEHVYLVNHGFNESEYGITQYGIHQIIDDAPTVDAVPVIRCKECKHVIVSATLEHKDESVTSFYMCDYMHRPTDAEGFCYMAERRTDGTEHDPD